jgi:hypothetical protein
MERGLGQGRPGGTSDLPRHHGDCLLEDVVLRRRRARGAPPLAPRHEGALHGRAEGNGCEPRRLQIEERPFARGHAARPAGRDGGGGGQLGAKPLLVPRGWEEDRDHGDDDEQLEQQQWCDAVRVQRARANESGGVQREAAKRSHKEARL